MVKSCKTAAHNCTVLTPFQVSHDPCWDRRPHESLGDGGSPFALGGHLGGRSGIRQRCQAAAVLELLDTSISVSGRAVIGGHWELRRN